MKSAYFVLGLPGDANAQEIRDAYDALVQQLTHGALSSKPDREGRLLEAKQAYQILSNPQTRESHDRRLHGGASTPREVVVEREATARWYLQPLPLIAMATVALFAIGGYLQHQRTVRATEQAALALKKKELEEQEAARQAQAAAAEQAERAQRAKAAEQNEQRMRNEAASALRAQMIADANAQREFNQQQRDERNEAARKEREAKYEAARKESERQSAQRQAQYDAQQRTAEYQRRIRALCMQNYGRPDC